MMHQTDLIVIEGLEFYAYHGASDQEQTVGHRYRADIKLHVDTRTAGATDRLSDTVSYARVAKRVVQFSTDVQFRLLEALAARLASVLLEEYPLVEIVELRIVKVCPPMDAIVASVGVEIVRRRENG
jgi:dihydroneopterin aldolase